MNRSNLHHPKGRLIHVKRAFAIVFAAAAILCSGHARAELVTFDFIAVWPGYAWAPEAEPPPPFGKTVNGYYTFESTTKPLPDYGQPTRFYPDTIRALQFVSGWYRGRIISVPNPKPWNFPRNEIRVNNVPRKDSPPYDVTVGFTGNNPSWDGHGFNHFGLGLRDYSGTAPLDNKLPLVPPDIANFRIRQVAVGFAVPNQPGHVYTSFFTLTSLTLRRPGTSARLPIPPAREFRMPSPAYVSKPSQPSQDVQQAVPRSKAALTSFARQCGRGFVWRGANGTDDVCVTPESRGRVAQENATAASRIDPKGAYGPNSCIAGYVWREAFNGDVVCVTPEVRALVRQENQRTMGGSR